MKAHRLALLALLFAMIPWHCPESIGLRSSEAITMRGPSPAVQAPLVVAMAETPAR